MDLKAWYSFMDFGKNAELSLFLLFVCGSVVCQSDLQIESGNASAALASEWDNLCAQLPDGSYPDYNQACRMFFVCSRGKKAATFWCTKGFVFSLTAGHCEPPDRALCPDTDNPSVLDDVVRLSSDVEECPEGDGVFPDYGKGCSSFYVCKGGIKTDFKCPGVSIYDWRTKSCRTSDSFTCNPVTCDNKKDGMYVDSSSHCRRYFDCYAGNVSQYVCPEGTIYNARHHRCTRSSVTRCLGLEAAQCTGLPDGYYPDFSTDCKVFGLCKNGGLKTFNCPAKTLFNSRTFTCEAQADCPKLDVSKCNGKNNGIHPDFESGCRDFYMCLDGLLTHQGTCPQGKLLNPINGDCQPSSLVTCSPVVDADCDGLPDGIYPDFASGCSAYFVCLNQRKISTAYCPGGDLYDVATGKCLPSGFVLCRDHSAFVSAPRLFDSYNCDNRLGIFPEFSSDCRRFVTCAYGQMDFHECKEGAMFDSETNSCMTSGSQCKAPFAIATFQCLPGDDGVYVTRNCTEWHECRNGIGFTNICPRGMQYDVNLGKCAIKSGLCMQEYMIQRRVFSSDVMPLEIRDREFQCPPKTIGVFTDSNSCRKFHFCVEGKLTSFVCPFNYSFDREQQACVFVGRRDRCENTRYKRVDNQPMTFSCEGLENGMYTDYNSDCRRYFVCENGNGVPVYCPDRQKFNSIKMMCDREEYVRCLPGKPTPTDPPLKRQNSQTDDIYHVYGHEDLFTENHPYVKHQPSTKPSDPKSRVWDDEYDAYSVENASPSSTDRNYESKVPNSIHNDADDHKRSHHSKHHSLAPTIDLKLPVETTVLYEDTTTTKTTKAPQSLDMACRKGDTGFFPDYESGCKMFHICFKQIRKTYSCPSVLLFNPETKNCDLPENVFCSKPEPLVETSFDCMDKMNQFVADYDSGCKYYVGCINNSPYRFTCPRGKTFNSVASVCEPESSFACEYPDDGNSSRDGKAASTHRHVHGIPGQFFFTCTEKPDGFYPDYNRHCHVFYRCVRGKKFSHYCKQGLLFNPESGICDFEENVTCSSETTTSASS
ncbi:hypothetical protein JTE90_002930 [Oedothorax gibbosus]|uniref:Chitin-binding type-2 domain-containing protein n=1 Tax=Oedothorax gibbosus TaxID=931172 RepID=A0AAV6UUF5_9ARAC|nr:hypothetical protein JTE90_002930 [Oedothorax gibbosus]